MFTIYAFLSIFCVHQGLKRYTDLIPNVQYYILHVLINTVVVILSTTDLLHTFKSPIQHNPDHIIPEPAILVLVLHIYHVIFFRNLHKIEYIHHLLMMSILLYPIFNPEYLPLANVMLFFTSGLPGLIIYLSLILYKFDYLSKDHQHYIDRKVNLYLRSPGILYTVFIVYLRYIYKLYTEFWITCLVQILLYWNAQYFTDLACR